MKSMTCNQLGGACDLVLQAENFEEMVQLSKQHGMEMFQKQDADHLAAMGAMKSRMEDAGGMDAWFDARRREFDALPDDD